MNGGKGVPGLLFNAFFSKKFMKYIPYMYVQRVMDNVKLIPFVSERLLNQQKY